MEMTFKVVSVIKATIDDAKLEKEEGTFNSEDMQINEISIAHVLMDVGGETHDITAEVMENIGVDTLMTMFQKAIGRN